MAADPEDPSTETNGRVSLKPLNPVEALRALLEVDPNAKPKDDEDDSASDED